MPEGKSMLPESYLLAYEKYMQTKTGNSQCGMVHNGYIDAKTQEGYKALIAAETGRERERVFGANRDKRPDSSEIIAFANIILQKRKNLINWNVVATAKDKLNASGTQDAVASVIRAIMCGDEPDTTYNAAADIFGYRFPLLAYLFFVSDSTKYLPVSPQHFDRCFKMFEGGYVNCSRLSRCGSWNVYSDFLQCVEDIRRQLAERYPKEKVALLDAHSVLWVIGSEKFLNFYNGLKNAMPPEILAKETIIAAKARIGQGEYRRQLLELWGGKCSVTGCSFTDALTASHAKPWKVCDSFECRDPFNGLMLVPNLDILFDGGFISFGDDGKIIISSRVDAKTKELLGVTPKMRLRFVEEKHMPYLKYHREKIFRR